MIDAWARKRTKASEAEILTQIRRGLVSYDQVTATPTCGCTRGDLIDLYHDMVFEKAGISTLFYGGNLVPQGVWPNFVPFDPVGNSKFDLRRLFN
jgi:hypothetical protein